MTEKPKDSFVLYVSWGSAIEILSDEQAGRVFRDIFEIAKGNKPCHAVDDTEKVVLAVIEPAMIANARKYEEKCRQNAENARKRHEREAREKERLQSQANAYDRIRTQTDISDSLRMHADNDSDSVSDNDIDSESDSVSVDDDEMNKIFEFDNKNDNVSASADTVERSSTVEQTCEIIIKYLNEIRGTNYQPKAKRTQWNVEKLLDIGYSVDEMKRVIKYKCNQWENVEDMEKYLRPDTLLEPDNFRKYLDEIGYSPIRSIAEELNPFT